MRLKIGDKVRVIGDVKDAIGTVLELKATLEVYPGMVFVRVKFPELDFDSYFQKSDLVKVKSETIPQPG